MDKQRDLFLQWLSDSKDAVTSLRDSIHHVKSHEEACCDVYAAASRAVMSLEHAIHLKILDDHQPAALPSLFSAMTSSIELAQLLVQVPALQTSAMLHTIVALCITGHIRKSF